MRGGVVSGDVSWSAGFTGPVFGGRRWTLLPLGPRESLPRDCSADLTANPGGNRIYPRQ